MFIKSLCKSQLPRKFVNPFFIITNISDRQGTTDPTDTEKFTPEEFTYQDGTTDLPGMHPQPLSLSLSLARALALSVSHKHTHALSVFTVEELTYHDGTTALPGIHGAVGGGGWGVGGGGWGVGCRV